MTVRVFRHPVLARSLPIKTAWLSLHDYCKIEVVSTSAISLKDGALIEAPFDLELERLMEAAGSTGLALCGPVYAVGPKQIALAVPEASIDEGFIVWGWEAIGGLP